MMVFALHQHESVTDILVYLHPHSPSQLPPLVSSGLSQSPDFEYPASCIEFALVIYFTYGNVHVSVLFS